MKRNPSERRRAPAREAAWGTIEFIRPGEAIVEVNTTTGKWLGGGLVKIRSHDRDALYEAAYNNASQRAILAGLSLERFSKVKSSKANPRGVKKPKADFSIGPGWKEYSRDARETVYMNQTLRALIRVRHASYFAHRPVLLEREGQPTIDFKWVPDAVKAAS